MRITVATAGTDELKANFQKLAREVSVLRASQELMDALFASLGPFVEAARRRARRSRAPRLKYKGETRPADPRHMADSIEVRRDKRRTFNRNGDLVVYAGPDARHWWGSKIEFGTRTARAWPFMRPAWAQTADQVFARVSRDFADRFERVVTKIRLSQPGRPGSATP